MNWPHVTHISIHVLRHVSILPNKNGTKQLIAIVKNWFTVTYNNCTFVGLADCVFKRSLMLGNSSDKHRDVSAQTQDSSSSPPQHLPQQQRARTWET